MPLDSGPLQLGVVGIPIVSFNRLSRPHSPPPAGEIVGLPKRLITAITLRNVQITAENDILIKDPSHIVFENVAITVQAGVAAGRAAYKE